MVHIIVLLRHFRQWNKKNCYIDYNFDDIMLKEYVSLANIILNSLNIDLITKCIKIKYIIKGNDTPIKYKCSFNPYKY